MSNDGFTDVVDIPSPEQRAALAKAEAERKRIVAVIEAGADGWRAEVRSWISQTDPISSADTIAEHVREPTRRVVERYLTLGAKPEIVSTGFSDLDELMSLEAGSLVVIGARSGRGKSSLAFQLAMNVALRGDGSSLYFSSEMPSDQLMLRGMCLMATVDSKRVRRGLMSPAEQGRLIDACNKITRSLAWMVDQSGLDVLRVKQIARAEARRIVQETGKPVKTIVVDYVQRVRAGKAAATNSNREQQVAAIALELKELAMELGVCVVAPAQLNADGDDRKDERPRSSDLRESKGIENEADAVLLIHNPHYVKRQSDPGHDASEAESCELILAKGRSDGNGTVPIWFTPMFTKFSSMTSDERDNWLREQHPTRSQQGQRHAS